MERILLPDVVDAHVRVDLPKEKAHYLSNVHRLKTGDAFAVFNGKGCEFAATLELISKRQAVAVIGEMTRQDPEPLFTLTLAQALGKQGKMETVIQKAVELGATSIQPFTSRHTMVKLKAQQLESKLSRWQTIADEAARQSRRTWGCEIKAPCSLDILEVEKTGVCLIAWEGDDAAPINGALSANKPESAIVIVGPEGGFDKEEIDALTARGVTPVSLGPRILRTETAGPVMVALAQYAWGDLSGDTPPYQYRG